MPTWTFTNVTRGTTFEISASSFSITDERPCQLASLNGRIDDLDGNYVLEDEDEIRVNETPDAGGASVVVFAGDVTKCQRAKHRGPRNYVLAAQDFTARLGDNVIDQDRDVQESVSARVAWIMGHSNRGLTSGHVQTIATLVDPHPYKGMSVMAALSQVAAQVDAIYFVDYSKSLHFFITELNPAPFDLLPLGTAVEPASYPYGNFAIADETPDLAHAVYVLGDGVELWREAVGAPVGPTRQERASIDNRIKTVAGAEQRGDTLLAQYNTPVVRGSLTMYQAGLQGGMTVRIAEPDWAVDDTFVVTSVRTSLPAARTAAYNVEFSDRYLCRPRLAEIAATNTSATVELATEVAQSFVDLSTAGANMIRNSSFESTGDWTQGSLWSAGFASSNPYHGTKTARLAAAGATTGELVTTDFILVDRTADWWCSFWSRLSAYTAGTAICQIREYDSGSTLVQSTNITLTAVESAWTRHSRHFGPTATDTRLAFHANTVKVRAYLWAFNSPTLTWEVDAFQLERSTVLTSYAPAPYELVDGSITTAKMADLAITLAKLADASVANAKLVNGAVDAVKLANAAVEAAKIATGAVLTAALADSAVTAVKITDAAVGTTKLADNAVTLQKLVVGSFDNLITNPGFEQSASTPAPWEEFVLGGGTWSVAASSPRSGLNALRYNPAGQTNLAIFVAHGDLVSIFEQNAATEGDQFYFEAWARKVGAGTANNVQIRVDFRPVSGAALATHLSALVTPTTTYQRVSVATPPAPAGTALVAFRLEVLHGGNAELIHFDDAYARRMVTGSIVVDGTITALQIAANTITAAKIAAGTITATELAAAAVTTAKLAAGAVTANEIAALAVTTAKLAAGAVTANEIAALAVTTAKLAAGAVIAEKVAAGAIETDKIAANAVVAGKIAADAVTATQIAANAVTAAKINASAVTAGKIAADAVTTTTLAANAVTAAKIAAGAITASKLYIVPADNLVEDPGFERADDAASTWAKGAGWSVGTVNPRSGVRAAAFAGSTAAMRSALLVDCRPGDVFYVSGWIRGTTTPADGTARVRVTWIDVALAEIGSSTAPAVTATGAYQESAAYVTAPASAAYVRAEFLVTGRTTGVWYADDLFLRRATDMVRNSASTTLIDSAGITVTGGAITVTNPSGTVIIDGTSNMFKIVATGTMTHTQAAWGGSGGLSSGSSAASIIGTGLPEAQSPAFIAYLTEGLTPLAYAHRDLGRFMSVSTGFVANTSGGSPTSGRVITLWHGYVFSGIDGSNNPEINAAIDNADTSTSRSIYVRYHVLKESAI